MCRDEWMPRLPEAPLSSEHVGPRLGVRTSGFLNGVSSRKEGHGFVSLQDSTALSLLSNVGALKRSRVC